MRNAGAFLIVIAIALAMFELPTALSPGKGDVGHGWAVAGAILAAILGALGVLLIAVDERLRRRGTKSR
ncbi:MAG: hypothetical protein ACK4TR_13415 [Phenylobacterium sp.]|uniref:hypothetical protein n=1 Tax=Phenylobacterium sp. TaxID=1871053 RepID=UPI00391CBCBC